MSLINIILGILFLIAGYKIFWLFLASLGFLFGFEYASAFFFGLPAWKTLLISAAFGLVGLLLALFLQGLAIVVAGLIAGSYIIFSLWNLFGWGLGQWWWILFILSGITVSILLVIFFNPVLIVLTSFIGAILIIQAFPLSRIMNIALFIVFSIVGIFVQGSQYFSLKK